MKNYFCFGLVLLGFSLMSHAQRLNAEKVIIEHTQPPRLKTDAVFKTYRASVQFAVINPADYRYNNITNGISVNVAPFNGQTLSQLFTLKQFGQAENADLVFTITLGNEAYPEVKIDKEQFQQIATFNSPPQQAPLSFDVSVPVLLSLRDKGGKLLAEYKFHERRTFQTTQQFLSRETAMEEWKRYKPEYRRTTGADVMNYAVRHANAIASSWVENTVVKDIYWVQTFRKAVKDGLERFDSPSADMLAALKLYAQDKRSDVLVTSLRPGIQFWEAELQKADGTGEKDKYIRYLCAYNLVQAYSWLGEFDKCDRYLETGRQTEVFSNNWRLLTTQINDKRPVGL